MRKFAVMNPSMNAISIALISIGIVASAPAVAQSFYVEADSIEYISPEVTLQAIETGGMSFRGSKSFRAPEIFGAKMATTQSNSVIETALDVALHFMGTPHRLGGMDSSGIDCSGLVQKSFALAKLDLPRVSYEIAAYGGRAVERHNLRRGDILCFSPDTAAIISHVGIVWDVDGDRLRFIHSSTSRGVVISSISLNNLSPDGETPAGVTKQDFWERRFRFAIRPVE